MPRLLLEAQSAGELAFSRDAHGHIVALHLQPDEGIMVREHQMLAASGHVQDDYSRSKGFGNMIYGGGFFVDEFMAASHEGVVWIHGYGNVFQKTLEPGETIDIEPGGRLLLGAAEAAEAADGALALIRGDPTLDPARALAAAKGNG